jgi:hypothetical protein
MKTKNLKKQTLNKRAQLFILSLLLAMPVWVQGQNWKSIGNTAASTDFIGTNNAQDFRIRTNGTQKAVVTTGGNVGIGTATPSARLEVNGQVKITDGTQASGKVLTSDANGLASWQAPAGGIANGSAAGNTLYWNGTSWVANNSNIFNNGGNVGIGTITPATRLDVAGGGINTDSDYRINGSTVLSKAGSGNIFAGENSGSSITTGYNNASLGYNALNSLTTGANNVGIGNNTMEVATFAGGNVAIGSFALQNLGDGFTNTAVGYQSMKSINTGNDNTAVGSFSLLNNISGISNCAVGTYALQLNNGNYNTGLGVGALGTNTNAYYNTAVGYDAGWGYYPGYNNVFLGANTNINAHDLFNVIACGQGTIVGSSSTARFGNSATVSYGGWADWTNISDGRFKKNVNENVPGIEFIKKLRPVTYNLEATGLDAFLHKNAPLNMSEEGKKVYDKALKEKEQITYTGFIAQEVEASAKELGFDFSGVDAAKNENDVYGLRYAEFVVPLVKAVQELNAELKKQNAELTTRIELLESKNGMDNAAGKTSVLEQNNPNPFSEITVIKYTIPASALKAEIKIFASDGREIKTIPVSEKGSGQTEISGRTLSPGIYAYVLLVDGKVVDTKQMVLTK